MPTTFPDVTSIPAGSPAPDRYADDLAFALRVADAADAITLARFGALDLAVETKPDLTPVSDADRGVETAIRDLVARERPGDGVFGEEFPEQVGSTGRRWVVDPVDGTKNFVRGVPVWATLIALQELGAPGAAPSAGGHRVVAAVVSAPAMARRWWASAGAGGMDERAARECAAALPGFARVRVVGCVPVCGVVLVVGRARPGRRLRGAAARGVETAWVWRLLLARARGRRRCGRRT